MSFFEDASLVLIPSAIKDQKIYSVKPTDGSGDLTFSRASSATRVASNGLIEKVRTNVILQSNTFNTTWGTTNATITSGATDPNGGTTAWTLANTGASGIIQQAATLDGLRSVSIYAKAGTHRYLYMGAYVGSGTDSYQVFDLQDGVIPTGSKGRIESIGGGWYRCTSYGADGTTGGVQILPSNVSTGAATTNGSILIWRCQYESGDIATDYIATTTVAVSVGPVSGLPRLDYLNSTCPRLLLEPQRVNLFNFSEQLDNAYWSKIGAITVTANNAVSPDGYQNADLVTGAGGGARIQRAFSGLTAGTRTLSCFVKAGTGTEVTINSYDGIVDKSAIFNVVTGVVDSTSAGVSATITNYGNGWYRLTHTYTSAGTSYSCQFFFDDGLTYRVWGMQFEDLSSYATSYIPTLGTSVTRVADAASKTGISSLIGQTEGTLFVDFVLNNYDTTAFIPIILTNTSADQVYFLLESTGQVYADFYFNASFSARIATSTGFLVKGTRYKMALVYKQNDFAFYINGQQIGTDNSGIVRSMISANFVYPYASGYGPSGNTINQALLFKTRLSNSDLATLTTL